MIARVLALGALVVAVALAASPPMTLASFTGAGATAATIRTLQLQPPTGVTAVGGTSAKLSWTPSGPSSASGYRLLRSGTSGSGYAQVATVTPVSATSAVDSPAPGTWFYVVQTYARGWTSANSNEAAAVVSVQTTTGTVGCDPTMQAAETSGSGNNNGYEVNPGNACAQGGGYATDANSGTDNVNSCTDAGKDRHRFWGYTFGLPATVTAINGITVTAVVGQSNSGGTSSICIQLSWDGGTTWTAPKQSSLTAASLTTYTLGSASDTWGHTWTTTQLGRTTFRVRITDVATTANKDFRLDSLGASVTYTP